MWRVGRSSRRWVRVSELLPGVLEKFGLSQRVLAQRAVELWKEVGPIARNTRAIGMKGEVLWVEVASPPGMQELELLKRELLRRLNERLGGEVVKDLKFRLR